MRKVAFMCIAAIFAMAIMSCSDSKNDLPTDGIFGEVPRIIQKYKDEMKEDLKDKFGVKDGKLDVEGKASTGEMLAYIIAKGMEYQEKVKESTADISKSMSGRKLPYVLSDSLPYTVDGDVIISKMEVKGKGISTSAGVDITLKEDIEADMVCIYIHMGNDTIDLISCKEQVRITNEMGYEKVENEKNYCFSNKYKIPKGSKFHFDFTIKTETTNPYVLAMCKQIKFVTEKKYYERTPDKNLRRILKELDKEDEL